MIDGPHTHDDVVCIEVEIVRFVCSDVPGFVECQFTDIDGSIHQFREKIPIVTAANVWSDTEFPQPGSISGIVVDRHKRSDGSEVFVVDTVRPDGIESTQGVARFSVAPDQLRQ